MYSVKHTAVSRLHTAQHVSETITSCVTCHLDTGCWYADCRAPSLIADIVHCPMATGMPPEQVTSQTRAAFNPRIPGICLKTVYTPSCITCDAFQCFCDYTVNVSFLWYKGHGKGHGNMQIGQHRSMSSCSRHMKLVGSGEHVRSRGGEHFVRQAVQGM